jgi:hypothetical protein
MPKRNILAALFLIAFGLWYAYLTSNLIERTLPNVPGPSFFPWMLTISLLLFSGMLLVQGLRGLPVSVLPPGWSKKQKTRSMIGILLLLVYLGVLPYLGFLLSTPPLFGGLMWTAGERRPLFLIGFSLAIPLSLFIVFRRLFQIVLPAASILG